ncbi:MAG: ferrous iron transport protein A [Tissierellia bacterium]|nr:ferrous iron transport protein A [Tissierellia bacterium]
MNISLCELRCGDAATVKRICAGGCATRRLYEMGFNTGAKIKVIKNDFGPVIVSLFGNKVAVGRGLAQKIMVDG